MSDRTAMERLLAGEILLDDIEDIADEWHDSDCGDVELHEYLGMTWDEYRVWAERPSAFRFVVHKTCA